jgi:hypothetical protein
MFPARSISHVLNFAGVRVSALVGVGWADIRVNGDVSLRISLEAAQLFCIVLRIRASDEHSPQSPKTPASKDVLRQAIHSCGMLPSAVDAALSELQVILSRANLFHFFSIDDEAGSRLAANVSYKPRFRGTFFYSLHINPSSINYYQQ